MNEAGIAIVLACLLAAAAYCRVPNFMRHPEFFACLMVVAVVLGAAIVFGKEKP